jgi:hypothetical protein
MLGRFDRNERFFGAEGQERLRRLHVAVVGVGGLGTHVLQQLAFLGVGRVALIDAEDLDKTNQNRYVTARHDDPIPGSRKVDLGERLILSIDPGIQVKIIPNSLVSVEAFEVITGADYVFGCVDREGPRLILNELCLAYDRPYLDLASDIETKPLLVYGGRVCFVGAADGCLVCLGVLDLDEACTDLGGPALWEERRALYGVNRGLLGATGPSVVSINGLVASLAVTEFMVGATGIRIPYRLLHYHGHLGKVTVNADTPRENCYYCQRIRGRGKDAEVERYIAAGVGAWLR